MRQVNGVGYEHMYVLGSIWYPLTTYCYADRGELTTIGIVKVLDNFTGEIKYYIGAAKGENKNFDEDLIVACGAKFIWRNKDAEPTE